MAWNGCPGSAASFLLHLGCFGSALQQNVKQQNLPRDKLYNPELMQETWRLWKCWLCTDFSGLLFRPLSPVNRGGWAEKESCLSRDQQGWSGCLIKPFTVEAIHWIAPSALVRAPKRFKQPMHTVSCCCGVVWAVLLWYSGTKKVWSEGRWFWFISPFPTVCCIYYYSLIFISSNNFPLTFSAVFLILFFVFCFLSLHHLSCNHCHRNSLYKMIVAVFSGGRGIRIRNSSKTTN